MAELKHSARLGKTFPVGWLAGWLRKAENKAQALHSWGWGLAELDKKVNPVVLTQRTPKMSIPSWEKMKEINGVKEIRMRMVEEGKRRKR